MVMELLTMSTDELKRISIIHKVVEKRLTQVVAAKQLGLTDRQVRRLIKDYKLHGAEGLISKQRGHSSNRKYSDDKIDEIRKLVTRYYYDFGPTFAAEKLIEIHKLKVSKETLRQWMVDWGLWKAKRQKQAQIHPQRDRRDCFGELTQIDGSPHRWFERRGPKCCLLVAIDDATSRLCSLHFEPTETTAGYFKLMRKYIIKHGIPLATYSDQHGIFRINLPMAREDSETQFGRAARQLGIEVICAHSPQAKGRVERANKTLQDRLIKEMRLLGISDIETANAYLPTFLEDHNRRFAVDPQSPEDAHQKTLPTDEEMNLIFSYQEERTISKNLEFSYDKMIYQIKTATKGYRLRHSIVTVCKDLNDVITLVCRGKILDYTCHKRAKRNADIVDSKQLCAKLDSIVHKAKKYIPPANHPWRHFIMDPAKAALNAIKIDRKWN